MSKLIPLVSQRNLISTLSGPLPHICFIHSSLEGILTASLLILIHQRTDDKCLTRNSLKALSQEKKSTGREGIKSWQEHDGEPVKIFQSNSHLVHPKTAWHAIVWILSILCIFPLFCSMKKLTSCAVTSFDDFSLKVSSRTTCKYFITLSHVSFPT